MIQNWAYNRPPDDLRVNEIVETGRFDGVIHVAHMNNRYYCYDGEHRRRAFLLYEGKGAKLLVQIMWKATEESVKEHFILLNKAVPVPSLYMPSYTQDDEIRIRDEVNAVVREMCRLFPGMQSTARRPHRPRFNRDTLMDALSEARLFGRFKESTDLMGDLMEMNEAIRARYSHVQPETDRDKKILGLCTTSGLFLFIEPHLL